MRKGAHGSQRSDRMEQSRTVGKRTTDAQRTVAAVGFPLLGLQLEPQAEHRSDLPTQGHGLDAGPLAQMGVGVLHAAAACTEHEDRGGGRVKRICVCVRCGPCQGAAVGTTAGAGPATWVAGQAPSWALVPFARLSGGTEEPVDGARPVLPDLNSDAPAGVAGAPWCLEGRGNRRGSEYHVSSSQHALADHIRHRAAVEGAPHGRWMGEVG